MEALRIILEKVTIGKLMSVLFIFALFYLFVPHDIQAFLDAKKISILPDGTLKAILFLTASYFCVLIIEFALSKAMHAVRAMSTHFKDKAAFEYIENIINNLPEEERTVIERMIKNDFQSVGLNPTSPFVLSLLNKGIITEVGSPIFGSSNKLYRLTLLSEHIIKQQIISQANL